MEQRIQMLLGIFAAHGALPLELKPAHNVVVFLVQYPDQLEQEAHEKGGVQQLPADYFAKVYKVTISETAT